MEDKRPSNKIMIIVGGLSILLGSIATAECRTSEAFGTEIGYRTGEDSIEYFENNYAQREIMLS